MFYKKGIDITNDRQMFEFLAGHYRYSTLNSWNGLYSVANCVKVYNLNLDGDPWVALQFLEDDEYYAINDMIRDWEREHQGYKVGFNGRSGGYLVLYNEHNNRSILPDFIDDAEDYNDYKENCKYYYGSVKAARSELVYYTKLVQDFDKLCDQLRDYVNDLSLRNFADEKLERNLEDFIYDFMSDMKTLGINYPGIMGREQDTILIGIDTKMRQYRSLMECFFSAIKENIWTILDDGSELIKLEVQ